MTKRTLFLYIISIIIFRILLDILYKDTISPNYAYYGLIYNPNYLSTITSWGILIIGILLSIPFLNMKKFVISHIAILLFAMFFVPWTSYLHCNPQSYGVIICESIYWIFLLLCLNISSKLEILHLKQKIYNKKAFYLMIIVMVATVIYVSGIYTNFRIEISLAKIYDWRLEARTFKLPILLEYIWAASTNILPVIVFYYLRKEKNYIAIAMALVIVISFSINGSKSTLFKLILCIILFFVHISTKFKFYIPASLALFSTICLLEFSFYRSSFLSELIIRRTFFIPAQLDGYYYEVIEKSGPIFFTHRINGHEITFLIGDTFFDKDYMRANNGLFSDAYMNLGIAGCFLFPIIYAILINLCESILLGLSTPIKFYIVFIICFTMRSSELTTALMTHGLLLLCLLAPLLREGQMPPTHPPIKPI